MPAATRPDVNPAHLIHVDAASVSIARDGSYELLLITGMRHVRCVIPMAVGLHVFQVTNPRCLHTPKDKPTKHEEAAARDRVSHCEGRATHPGSAAARDREPITKPGGHLL